MTKEQYNEVMQEKKKCVIEGYFDVKQLSLQSFFDDKDLDYEPICILRREINSAGKSRAFVNDTPVKLPLMKELGIRLMDIHSQNQNHQLNNALFRLNIVDAYSNHSPLLNTYSSAYKEYRKNEEKLIQLQEQYQQQQKEQEYHQFLFDEIEEAQIKRGEQQEIEEELAILNHAEEIKSALYDVSQEVLNSDLNLVSKIQNMINQLEQVATYQQEIADKTIELLNKYGNQYKLSK